VGQVVGNAAASLGFRLELHRLPRSPPPYISSHFPFFLVHLSLLLLWVPSQKKEQKKREENRQMNKQKSNNNITNMDDSLYVRVSLIFFFFSLTPPSFTSPSFYLDAFFFL
jgi:hypothetical protein